MREKTLAVYAFTLAGQTMTVSANYANGWRALRRLA
jgi:hypothetical protein